MLNRSLTLSIALITHPFRETQTQTHAKLTHTAFAWYHLSFSHLALQ